MADIVETWKVKELYLARVPVDESEWPKLTCSAAKQLELTGSLSIAGGTLTAALGPNMVGKEQLKADLVATLVTNGDNHDHSGGDGAPIKHSSLQLDGGRNPHGTTAADIQALPIAGGRITGDLQVSGSSVFYGKVGIGTATPEANLHVNGSIKSPMWKVTQVLDNQAGDGPLVGSFTSNGGVLIIFVSGAAFSDVGNEFLEVNIMVDNANIGKLKSFANLRGLHGALSSNLLVVNNVREGNHSLKLLPSDITKVNRGDFFCATVLELPWKP